MPKFKGYFGTPKLDMRVTFKRVGLFYLRVSLFDLRLVFVAYGQLAWSFYLQFDLFCLR